MQDGWHDSSFASMHRFWGPLSLSLAVACTSTIVPCAYFSPARGFTKDTKRSTRKEKPQVRCAPSPFLTLLFPSTTIPRGKCSVSPLQPKPSHAWTRHLCSTVAHCMWDSPQSMDRMAAKTPTTLSKAGYRVQPAAHMANCMPYICPRTRPFQRMTLAPVYRRIWHRICIWCQNTGGGGVA